MFVTLSGSFDDPGAVDPVRPRIGESGGSEFSHTLRDDRGSAALSNEMA